MKNTRKLTSTDRRVLAVLSNPKGVLTSDLKEVTPNYSESIYALRKNGYKITSSKTKDTKEWYYVRVFTTKTLDSRPDKIEAGTKGVLKNLSDEARKNSPTTKEAGERVAKLGKELSENAPKVTFPDKPRVPGGVRDDTPSKLPLWRRILKLLGF